MRNYKINDEVQLLQEGKLLYKKLIDWIDQYPDTVYYHLYLPGPMRLVKISITKSAYIQFKKNLAKKFPVLYKQLITKQFFKELNKKD
jgi:hypothetical protein